MRYVACTVETEKAHSSWTGNPDENGLQGRTLCWIQSNIKISLTLKKWEVVNWNDMAQNRDQRPDLVNMFMKFYITQNQAD
jgi:hypothetical protein